MAHAEAGVGLPIAAYGAQRPLEAAAQGRIRQVDGAVRLKKPMSSKVWRIEGDRAFGRLGGLQYRHGGIEADRNGCPGQDASSASLCAETLLYDDDLRLQTHASRLNSSLLYSAFHAETEARSDRAPPTHHSPYQLTELQRDGTDLHVPNTQSGVSRRDTPLPLSVAHVDS